jgi:adenosylhomocysteinase
MQTMKDGAIICNSGHFNVEIDLDGLEQIKTGKRNARPLVEEYKLANGHRIYILADGRLVNIAAAEGHPASVMDMSFANQSLMSEWVVKNQGKLENKVYDIPMDIDANIAALKLKSLNISIDTLTPEQQKYLSSWEMGT